MAKKKVQKKRGNGYVEQLINRELPAPNSLIQYIAGELQVLRSQYNQSVRLAKAHKEQLDAARDALSATGGEMQLLDSMFQRIRGVLVGELEKLDATKVAAEKKKVEALAKEQAPAPMSPAERQEDLDDRHEKNGHQ